MNTAPPIFDRTGKETVTQYMRRVQEYEVQLRKDRYDVILNFVNIWGNENQLKFKSLLEFKKIPDDKVIDDVKNKKICKTHKANVCEQLNIDNDTDLEETDTDDIPETEFITFMRKILKTINYSINKTTINKKGYYTIKMNS